MDDKMFCFVFKAYRLLLVLTVGTAVNGLVSDWGMPLWANEELRIRALFEPYIDFDQICNLNTYYSMRFTSCMMFETHIHLEEQKYRHSDCEYDLQKETYQRRQTPDEAGNYTSSDSSSAQKKRRPAEDDNSSAYEHDGKGYDHSKPDITDIRAGGTSSQNSQEDGNRIGNDNKFKRSDYKFKREEKRFSFWPSWERLPFMPLPPPGSGRPVQPGTEGTSDSVTCRDTVFSVCKSSDDSPALTEEQEKQIRANFCGIFMSDDEFTEECGPDRICRIIHSCEKWTQFDASPYYVTGSTTLGAGGSAGRRRRRSVGKRQITASDHDIDMCCPTRTRWISNDTIVNINGDTRTVVHLRSLEEYQFLPHGRCAGVDESCSGQCQQQNVLHYILVWIGFQLRFDAFQIPGYCSCKNVVLGG